MTDDTVLCEDIVLDPVCSHPILPFSRFEIELRVANEKGSIFFIRRDGYKTLSTSRALDKLRPILFRGLHYLFQSLYRCFFPLTTIPLLRNNETARMTRLLRIRPHPPRTMDPRSDFQVTLIRGGDPPARPLAVVFLLRGARRCTSDVVAAQSAACLLLGVCPARTRHNCIPCSMGYRRHAVAPPDIQYAAKRSFEQPESRLSSERPPSAPRRRRIYPLPVAGYEWATARRLREIIGITVFWNGPPTFTRHFCPLT